MADGMSEPRQLRISTAKDIIDALQSSDTAIRFSVLQSIYRYPEKALRYGSYEGRDLIDELCDIAGQLPDSSLRTVVLYALSVFRDDRSREAFRQAFITSNDIENVTLAADFLAAEPEEEVRDTLSCFLLQDTSHLHARVAADAMAGFQQLSTRERIRIAMLASKESLPPAMSRSAEAEWLKELNGAYKEQARQALAAWGESGFLLCKKVWGTLDSQDKIWLLNWGATAFPAYTVELVLAGLDSGNDQLIAASLESIKHFGQWSGIFDGHVRRFLIHADPGIRAAAVRVGASGVDWESALATETDSDVKLAILPRLVDVSGVAAAPTIIDCMLKGDYQVRAVAVSALQRFAGDIVESIKPLVEHEEMAVRVAAAQILIAAGEESWLETRFLSDPM